MIDQAKAPHLSTDNLKYTSTDPTIFEYSLMSLVMREEYYRQVGKIPNLCDPIMVELHLGVHFED